MLRACWLRRFCAYASGVWCLSGQSLANGTVRLYSPSKESSLPSPPLLPSSSSSPSVTPEDLYFVDPLGSPWGANVAHNVASKNTVASGADDPKSCRDSRWFHYGVVWIETVV